MLKIVSFLILGVVFIFITFDLHADTTIEGKTIDSIRMGWGGGAYYITLTESITPVEGCTASVFQMPESNSRFKENLSIALSAFHASSKVSLYVSGCLGSDMHLKAVGVSR